jgi:hypothetical protein
MATLASLFPLLVFLVGVVLAFFVYRLNNRLGRGAQSAGPRHVLRPAQAGLQRTPWELQAIDDQLRLPANSRSRTDLVNTINRLSKAAGEPDLLLGSDASNQYIAAVLDRLEQRLDLPPLIPGDPPHG